jgi:hypothetical protein
MKYKSHKIILSLFLMIFILTSVFWGCGGDEFNINQLPLVEGYRIVQDTNYIEQQIDNVWAFGFNQPQDVLIGFDGFCYVCDTYNDRVVMLDLAGTVIGSLNGIKRPRKISQDHRFNLLITAEFDTTVNNQFRTYGAIYKVALYDYSHNINVAIAKKVYWESSYPDRRFTGISSLVDNSYYVARVGPDNASAENPDNAVLHFSKSDVLYSKDQIDLTPALSAVGYGLTCVPGMSSLMALDDRRNPTDFLVTQITPAHQFKIQWIKFAPGNDIIPPAWVSKFQPSGSGLIDFLSGFPESPEDVTMDLQGYIYVIDSKLDSLFRFTKEGKLSQESFGNGKMKGRLKNPMGVAWFDRTLYIADTGNDRVLRFRLSTDSR